MLQIGRIMWVAALLACAPKAPPTEAGSAGEPDHAAAIAAGAGTGVAHEGLRGLLLDHWDAQMARYPTWASELGDRRFDGLVYDPSAEAREAWVAERARWIARARALDASGMSEQDQLTLELLRFELESDARTDGCRFERWSVSARSNMLVAISRVAEGARLSTPEDAASLLARFRAMKRSIRIENELLRQGLAEGLVGNADSLAKVVAMLETELAAPIDESSLLEPIRIEGDAPLAGWDQLEVWRTELRGVVESDLRPALAEHLALVRGELLPAARTGSEIGVGALPGGAACYDALIRSHTTIDSSAEELHQLGLSELESIHAEFAEIGERVFGTRDRAEIFRRLREDPELRFDTEEEVQATAEEALARAEAAIPEWFGRLPQKPCIVEPIPDYLAPYTTIAYYQPARPDGSRPGTYYVNVYQPETRPRHEAEVLAFHESIPGHHLQIAIAQELGELPAFRRYGGVTAFVEGWALYIERLANEMGLYSGDVDRLGMLSFDAWRASRLVVDTGIHAKGWSREQAEAFMRENTPLAINNIANEVDRYVTTPGQALAYKVGQLRIAALRARAEEAMGDRFSLPGFHDRVLGQGPLPMPVLTKRIEAWAAGPAPSPEPDTADGTSEPREETAE